MDLIHRTRALLPGVAITVFILAHSAYPQSAAVKLWPQITDGIRNHVNLLAMNCRVAEDGLTVTDIAWDSYQVEGCAKRWTLNMGAPINAPLKNYRFAPEFSGLPVNLTVEFYNPAKPWEVRENYQEILLLGGPRRGNDQDKDKPVPQSGATTRPAPAIGLPPWFRIPIGRLAYDFDEGDWFPSGWTLPRGKYALWQGAAKARQQDRKGRCPMYDFGFTHVAPCAMTRNGDPGTRERRGLLFTDNEWIPHDGASDKFTSDPTDPKSWRIEPFHHYAEHCTIIIPDFEAPLYHTWQDRQYEAFSDLIGRVRATHPDILIGCWGVGVVRSSFRIFDSFYQGKPTGVIDLKGAKQWRDKYGDNNPGGDAARIAAADIHPVFDRCGLNLGNPSVYWINNSKPSQLYAFLQEWEQGKAARPAITNILSTWIQVEFVDNYPLSQYRFTDAAGKVRLEGLKHQVPASSTYALSLFGHCVMDGLQCWEVGTRYSEELADYSDWRVREHSVKRAINGIEVDLNYYLKYFGLYNYHVLGMWQASRNKDIIEAPTAWEMPEMKSSRGKVWRTGDERYPSYANFYQEPLVRTKLSGDSRTLLVVACNPHNHGVQQVQVRRPGRTEEYSFQLVGDFPIIQCFPVGTNR